MKEIRLTEKVLVDGDRVNFTGFTEQYGRAEFAFCAIWKRGRIVTLYIYPMQQAYAKHWYRVESRADGLAVHSWTHKGMENPWIWRHVWCKDHKCMCFHAYVPSDATHFTVQTMSTLRVNFDR